MSLVASSFKKLDKATASTTKSIRVLTNSSANNKDCGGANNKENCDSGSDDDDDDVTTRQSFLDNGALGANGAEFKIKTKSKSAIYCSGYEDANCLCYTLETVPTKLRTPNELNKRYISIERLNELRKRAQESIKAHKVFSIRGCFYTIRKALLQRGWIEKLDIHRRASMPCNLTLDEMLHQLPGRRPGESKRQYLIKCERNIISRFLEYTPVDFLWTVRKEKDWIDMARNPTLIVNKFHKVPFTSKEGLCSSLRDFQWFFIDGVVDIYYPRCYNVFNLDELNDFIDDFRLTACIGILKWFVNTHQIKGTSGVASANGSIPITSIQFAIKRCREFVNSCEHIDIDSCEDERRKIWEHDWDVFLTHHYLLTHEDGRILDSQLNPLVISMAEKVIADLEPFWPQFREDGYLNIWIIKPGNRCRGKGIFLMNNIKKIINMVNPSTITKSRFVVQKYMERPLTIHKAKFDIRQWFLVTSAQPLVVWIYKESYLRFSSQEYNLLNYHESIHLTNHAIQKKYENGQRDERLPKDNMWDNSSFEAYLRQIGKPEMWDTRIYPGMQKAIIAVMLASQDAMDRSKPNTFELFGADFMIGEDFNPWLIEINSSPDLGSSTSVTARLCPQCLEDTIKVVIDRKNDSKADTGKFEIIYKQYIPPQQAYMGLNLYLKGQQIKTNNNQKKEKPKEEIRPTVYKPSSRLMSNLKTEVPIKVIKTETQIEKKMHQGPKIMDLIDCLAMKNYTPSRNATAPVIKKSNSGLRTQPKFGKMRTRIDLERSDQNQWRRHNSCGRPPKILTNDFTQKLGTEEDNKVITKLVKDITTNDEQINFQTCSSSPGNTSRSIYEGTLYKSKSATSLCKRSQNLTHKQFSSRIGDSKTWPSERNGSTKSIGDFYAVGLSLQAWRAKYNLILDNKIRGDNKLKLNKSSPLT